MQQPSIKPITWVITGGGSGIGLAIARAAADRGDNVLLNGRTESKLRSVQRELGAGARVAVAAGDITRPGTGEAIMSEAFNRFGRVDVLVNNAGIFWTKPFTDYTVEELDGFLGYLRGTYLTTQAAVRQMRAQGGGGAIVNIGTILTSNAVAGLPSSAPIAAKGGITALTKNLAVELAADRIRINAVAPGVVPTPLYGELTEEQLAALHRMQPLGRYGTPEDVAKAVIYLVDADWVTGVVLPVDGGVDASGDGASRVAEHAGTAT